MGNWCLCIKCKHQSFLSSFLLIIVLKFSIKDKIVKRVGNVRDQINNKESRKLKKDAAARELMLQRLAADDALVRLPANDPDAADARLVEEEEEAARAEATAERELQLHQQEEFEARRKTTKGCKTVDQILKEVPAYQKIEQVHRYICYFYMTSKLLFFI